MAVKLPTLVQDIVLNPAGLKRGAASTVTAFEKVSKATDATNKGIGKMDAGLYSLSFRAQTVGRRMLRGFALPIFGAVGLAVNSFGKFENSLVRIEGLVGVSTGQVEKFGEAVKNAASETGRGPQELADAMFFIASAGIRGSTAIDVLNASAKAAAIGLGQTKAVADAATSAVNAYGAENLSGSEAVDVLTAAVREGKVEAERLAPAIGKAIPVASAMGIEFHEVAAAIAAMTRTGTDARTSAIQLRQIMQSLLDPSRQTETALRELGVAQGELADQAREKGLLFVLKRIRDLSEENEEAFADVFPNIRALAGALDITGENLAENEQIFAALSKSTGDTDKAFRLVRETVQFKFNTAMADLKNATLEAGAAFAPLINVVAKLVRGFAELIKVLSGNILGSIVITIAGLAAVMGTLLVAGGAATQGLLFFKEALIKVGTASKAATGAAAAGGAATSGKGIMGVVGGLSRLGKVGLIAGAALASTAIVFGLLRRNGESAAEKVAKTRRELSDVKSVADISIKSLEAYAQAIRGIKAAMDGLTDAQRGFKQAFNDTIDEVFEESDDTRSAGLTALDALIRTFGGQEGTDQMRQNFDEIFTLLKTEYDNFVSPELLEEVFGTTVGADIFSMILGLGEDGTTADALRLQIRTQMLDIIDNIEFAGDEVRQQLIEAIANVFGITDTFEISATGSRLVATLEENVLQMLRDDFNLSSDATSGEIIQIMKDNNFFDLLGPITELIEGEIKDLSNVLDPVGKTIVDSLTSNDFVVIADIFGSAIESIADSVSEEELSQAIETFNIAFATAIARNDKVRKDFELGVVKYEGPVDLLLGIRDKFIEAGANFDDDDALKAVGLGPDIANRDNLIQFALFVEEAAAKIDKAMASQVGTIKNLPPGYVMIGGIPVFRDVAILEEANKLAQEAVEIAKDASEDPIERGLRTVTGVFEDLEVAVGKASAEAKKFKDRFDDLVGSLFELEKGRIDLVGQFQSMADAFVESGGSIDIFTEKGRSARKAIIDVIEGAVDMAGHLLETQQVTQGQAAGFVQDQIDILLETARLNGASVEEVQNVLNELGLQSENGVIRALGLVGAPGQMQTTGAAFNEQLDMLEQGIIGFMDFNTMRAVGANVITGIQSGMLGQMKELHGTAEQIMDQIEASLLHFGIISSPSIRFAEEVGQPITAGIAKGILDDRSKIRFTIKELVNDTINTAQSQIGSVFDAIGANLSLEEARRNLDKAMRDFGQEGEITKRESLTRKQLERDLKAAERAMRLGQGHQEDLELSLLDAQEALEEFDANVTSGAPVTEAQVGLMQAGFEMANAVAVMKMEGDKAIELFKNLGETMGLPMDNIESSLAVATSNIDTYRNMFGPDVLDAIERAADAFMIIDNASGDSPGILPGINGLLGGAPGTGSGRELPLFLLESIFGGPGGATNPWASIIAAGPSAAPEGVLMDPAFNNYQSDMIRNDPIFNLAEPLSYGGKSQAELQSETLAAVKALGEDRDTGTPRGPRGGGGGYPSAPRPNKAAKGAAYDFSGLTAYDLGIFKL